MGIAAGRAHLAHLVVERLPVAGQDMAAGNDDVDFLCARPSRFRRFRRCAGDRATGPRESRWRRRRRGCPVLQARARRFRPCRDRRRRRRWSGSASPAFPASRGKPAGGPWRRGAGRGRRYHPRQGGEVDQADRLSAAMPPEILSSPSGGHPGWRRGVRWPRCWPARRRPSPDQAACRDCADGRPAEAGSGQGQFGHVPSGWGYVIARGPPFGPGEDATPCAPAQGRGGRDGRNFDLMVRNRGWEAAVRRLRVSGRRWPNRY
jgi:hypothetical protein